MVCMANRRKKENKNFPFHKQNLIMMRVHSSGTKNSKTLGDTYSQELMYISTFSNYFAYYFNLLKKIYSQEIQANNIDGHLAELCDFVKESRSTANVAATNNVSDMTLLRVAALLTGINKPDHHQYFRLLSNTLSKKKIARTVFLPARDCPNVRTAIETLVSCLLSNGRKHNYRDEGDVVS